MLSGEPYVIRLQDEEHRGFGEMVGAIMRMAENRIKELNDRQRRLCAASDLVVGLQCGGSDAFSGVTANPAVGYAADLLVRAGATVMFSEVTEVRDVVHLLTARSVSVDVARAVVREMAWYDDYLLRGGTDRSANPAPGNKRGGLANIVEKALGSVAKAGSTALMAATGPGERVLSKGLVFAATPAGDFICGTLQLAASMNMHVFTTGEGSPYGLAMAPVLKVSTRTNLADRWPDLIDVDAGRIAGGEATIEQVGWEIFHAILEVASGKRKPGQSIGGCTTIWHCSIPHPSLKLSAFICAAILSRAQRNEGSLRIKEILRLRLKMAAPIRVRLSLNPRSTGMEPGSRIQVILALLRPADGVRPHGHSCHGALLTRRLPLLRHCLMPIWAGQNCSGCASLYLTHGHLRRHPLPTPLDLETAFHPCTRACLACRQHCGWPSPYIALRTAQGVPISEAGYKRLPEESKRNGSA